MLSKSAAVVAFLCTVSLGAVRAGDLDVVISEVHYHPAEAAAEAEEFLELQNLSGSAVDLSGWSLREGIDFTFPAGSVLPGGGAVVVARDRDLLMAAYGISGVLGNFAGRLSNGGEKIALRNAKGRLVDRVAWRDAAPWPENADGLGPSLEKSDLRASGEEQSSWRSSIVLGGTPGRRNSTDVRRTTRALIAAGDDWKYMKGTAEPATPLGSWARSDFDDSSWPSGPSGFGFGDSDDATVLPDMRGSYTTVYLRRALDVTSLAGLESLVLSITYDDGYVAYLNGTEIIRSESAGGTPGQPLAFDARAALSHENDQGTDSIDLLSTGALLKVGRNVLAIQVLNEDIDSSDLTLIPTLTLVEVETAGMVEPAHDLEINEIVGGPVGFVEVFNEGSQPADLSGLELVASSVGAGGYAFPAGTVLGPRAFLSVPASALPFELRDSAQWIGLATQDLRFVDGLEARDRPAGSSFGRFPDGDGDTFVLAAPSSGVANVLAVETGIVIDEVRFHPPLATSTEEFIELLNRSDRSIDISAWSLDGGVRYAFPASTVLPPGGFLVVSGDPPAVEARYGLSGVLGPWTGRLSNNDDKLELLDALGNRADVVHYADDGRWPASTELAGPDGHGPSVELVNAGMENNHGSAWVVSAGAGTPGAANSGLVADPPPVIRSVSHSPASPRSTEAVTVTARVSDEGSVASVKLFSRLDGSGAFAQTPMTLAPLEGADAFAATLPARDAGEIVQFYIEATDGAGHARRFPSDAPTRVCLYQVDDRDYPPGLPLYRTILRQADVDELTNRSVDSNVLLDGSFVHGKGVTYNVGVRYRGENSRDYPYKSFRIQFAHDEPFDDITDLNLNAENPALAYLAADFFRRADVPVFQSLLVAFTLDGVWQTRHGGVYVRVEDADDAFVERLFPGDDTGNLYRGVDTGSGYQGDLRYRGTDPSAYVTIYEKKTNQEENDYTDLMGLTDAFTNTSDAAFPATMEAVIDVEEWLRYLAAQTAVNNRDGFIGTSTGEDYFIYHRPSDGRWVILPWDLNEGFTQPTQGIFRQSVPSIRRLVQNPAFVDRYYAILRELTGGPFSEEVMAATVESVRAVFPSTELEAVDAFVPVRLATIRGLLPAQVDLPFVRGDANADGAVDISDAVRVLVFLFAGGPAPACLDPLDADDGGTIDLTDAVFVLRYLFQDGPQLPSPFPDAGADPTPGDPYGCPAP